MLQTVEENDPARSGDWLSARDAAALLGVSVATLYSYVSRDRLHPRPVPGTRAKRYRRDEVQRLVQRHAGAREPRRVAEAALNHGLPVLASSLSLIEHGRLHYRGLDALELAGHATIEDVAALLWDLPRDRWTDAALVTPRLRSTRPAAASPTAVLHAFHRVAAAQEPAEPMAELSTSDDASAAWQWVQAMQTAVTGRAPRPRAAAVHVQIAAAWKLDADAAEAVRHALVLCADHELNASSFTSRCVAGTGASLPAAVGGALAALTGPAHGGMTERIEAWWTALDDLPRTARATDAWLAARPQPPGFGHPLYPAGDPRGRALLERLPRDARRDRLVAAMAERTGLAPVLDFGLVAMRRALGAPRGAAFGLFAVARTVGWIGHALEQRRSGVLIRPRAAYVGPRPGAPGAS